MPSFFCDTSAIVKRYVREAGSGYINELTHRDHGNAILLARITQVEVAAAIARRLKGKSITKTDAEDALYAFERDLTNKYISIEITTALLSEAMNKATQHALRGYDAVQLVAALQTNEEFIANELPPLILVSADTELNTAAKFEGLLVENPNDYP